MGYDDQTEKSNACGLKSLPQGKELASGFVVIAEFGIYFIHELCKKHILIGFVLKKKKSWINIFFINIKKESLF